MAHTFLFEPAVWVSGGTLWREDGEALETTGRVEITHRPQCWLLSGSLKVLGSPPTEFVHAYLIEKPAPGDRSFGWTFDSALFGKLQGRFAVIGSSIVSTCSCDATGCHGAEHFGQIDFGRYRSTGMLVLAGRMVYSWQMLLEREGG